MRKLNHWIALAISLTALVFASCGSGFVEGATTEGDISKTVKKTVTFTAYGDEGIVTFPFKEADGARTILPTALDGRNLHFYYWGENKLNADDTTIKQPKEITFYADGNSYGRTGAIELDLPTSQYTLYLYATPSTVTLSNTTTTDQTAVKAAAVLVGTSTVDLRYNEKVNFYLTPYITGGATGNVSLKVCTNWTILAPYTNDTNIRMYIRRLTDNTLVGDATVNLSDTQITAMNNTVPAEPNFTKNGLPAGTYNFQVEFINPELSQSFFYTETIVILPNQLTEKTVIVPPVTGKAPDTPESFTVRYVDPENTKTGYYDAEFLWKDKSNNEHYFQIDLMDVTTLGTDESIDTLNGTGWDSLAATHIVTSYTNNAVISYDPNLAVASRTTKTDINERYVAGSLNANADFYVLSLDLGKRYWARITAVNDAGASDKNYYNFSVVDGSSDGQLASKSYTRAGASAAVETTSIKTFAASAKAINRFRITYNLVKGAYYQTNYVAAGSNAGEINEITWDATATQTNISSLDGTASADVRYYTQTPVVLNSSTNEWESGGNFILNPLKVESTSSSGVYYSLAKNKNSWTGWKLNSVEGTTIYTLNPANTAAKPTQNLVCMQTDSTILAAYKTPYEGFENLDLFAVYGKAGVSIYNPADKEILDSDVLVYKANTTGISTATQVITLDEANAFRANINNTSGYKILYVAVRNKNYSKIKMTIADQGNGVRYEKEGTAKTSFAADRYILLTKEPDDWATNLTSYYKKDGRAYVACEDPTDATWAAKKYYYKVEDTSTNNFTYFEIPIATNYAPGSAYTITIYAYTQSNTKHPFTMPLTMSVVDSATAVYSPSTIPPLSPSTTLTNYFSTTDGTSFTAATGTTWSKGTSNSGIWQKD